MIYSTPLKKGGCMTNYHSKNHAKFLIKYHLIMSVKYRHQLLSKVGEFVKNCIYQIAKDYDFIVDEMQVDKDHIHILLDLTPNQLPSNIVKIIKSITTMELWDKREKILKSKLWGTPHFWTRGYFICSTGDASTAVVAEYIKNQG